MLDNDIQKADWKEGESTFGPYFGAASWIFLVGMFMKQFYIFSSGGIQPGDILFVISFLVLLLSWGPSFRVSKKDYLFLLFVLCVCVINAAYSLILNDRLLLLPCAYYFYNALLIMSYRYIGSDSRFAKHAVTVCRIVLVLQLLLYLSHLGRWFDDYRYMGTFNDPNQFAFYILTVRFLGQSLSELTDSKTYVLEDILAFALILTSLSSGMVAAFAVYALFKYIVLPIKQFSVRDLFKSLVLAIIVGLLTSCILMVSSNNNETIFSSAEAVVTRVRQKVSKFGNISVEGDYSNSIILDRNLDKVLMYPEYMVLGSGEGGWNRFQYTRNDHEIHSTWIALLFSYGILPTILVALWVIHNLNNKRYLTIKAVHIALILESLTLANQRQPLFWILLMVASVHVYDNSLGIIKSHDE